MHFMPDTWHYISGQFSLQAPRKPQKPAIFLPQAPPKLLNFRQAVTHVSILLAVDRSNHAEIPYPGCSRGSAVASNRQSEQCEFVDPVGPFSDPFPATGWLGTTAAERGQAGHLML